MDSPRLVVSFELPDSGVFDWLRFIVVSSHCKGKLESFLCRELLLGTDVGVADTHHDRRFSKLNQLNQVHGAVEDYEKHADDGDN